MWVLHTHWQPPRQSANTGGIFFWVEDSEFPEPEHLKGSLPKHHKPKDHPFSLTSEEIRQRIGSGTPLEDSQEYQVTLHLPATRSGPIPSPELIHSWDLDDETPPFLAPFTISGLWLAPSKAFSVLANLPVESPERGFVLGQDAQYWQIVCKFVLEILAQQKILPTLIPIHQQRSVFYARWSPIMDSEEDGLRLGQLIDAMPPVCRSENLYPERPYPSFPQLRPLLDSFINTMCDALARAWGKVGPIRLIPENATPFETWLKALFENDATVKGSAVQMESLNSSLRAWTRNLNAAGDHIYRVAFQLSEPQEENGDPESAIWTLRFLLQARDDPGLLVPSELVWSKRTNSMTVMGKRFDAPQEKLLAGLGYAARHFDPIIESLHNRYPTSVQLDTETAYSFLREAAPILKEAGFGLLTPPWWNQRGSRLGVRLRLLPQTAPKRTGAAGNLGMDALVQYHWELSLGETELSREEFEALVALKQPLVQIRGQWVQLDQEQIEAARHFWEKENHTGKMGLVQAAQYALGGQTSAQGLPVDGVDAEGWVAEWLDSLSGHEKMSILPQPKGLTGKLRPYQTYGYSWMTFFRRWGLGACLADDMGLGKTIQALAMLLREKEINGEDSGPVLLVCPTSVVTNWEREVRRFAPSLKTYIHQGPARLHDELLFETVKKVDLIFTSYPLLRLDQENLLKINWYGVILDEAQNIKNPAAKQSQIAHKLKANFRFALTGTPVENRLMELWSIMQFLNPGYLGNRESFQREFAIPIERFRDPDATSRLKSLVSPFILRRVKSDPTVIQDLPDKIEMKAYCNLTEEQASLYEAAVKNAMDDIATSEGIQRHGMVLAMLVQLKQICNHPLQYLHQINGHPHDPVELTKRSGKLIRLTEMLEEIVSAGDRVLIFTQFAEMGKLLFNDLPAALNSKVLFLHGGTPVKQRDQMVRRFQEDPNGPQIFILSLKAGGIGINLTRATHVIHFDRWWNPAVEDQATDRAFRIGQKQNVEVHKFVTLGTLEERIDEMIESKKGLAESILGSGENWLTDLSTEELQDLVRLRR